MSNQKNQKTNSEAPAAIETDALQRFAQLTEALNETHARIPELLKAGRDLDHQLALAEVQGRNADALRQQVTATEAARESAARRRAACVNGILGMESELRAARADLEREQAEAAEQVSREFSARWKAACEALNALRAEASLLSRWLRCDIPTPAPDAKPLAMSEPAAAPPAHVQAMGQTLDRLDSALSRIGGVKQAKRFDGQHFELSRIRNTPVEFRGVYTVQKSFDSMEDGLPFAPGDLVDSSLIGAGMFHRLTLTRHLRPAELAVNVAA